MITKLQITGKLHYHRKCDFQLSKRKLWYRTLLPLTAPMSVCRTVSEIFSVKKRRDLETGVGVVQGHKKWRRSIDHTTFYSSAIASISVCCIIFKLFDVE